MRFGFMKVCFAVLFFLGLIVPFSFADEMSSTDEEISALKAQVQELMQRIDKLETEQALGKQEAAKAKEEVAKIKETAPVAVAAAKVDLANALSKLKLKGRAAAGFFDSGKAGSFPAGSFEVPDAKIQFAFQPDDINTVTLRFKLDNAVTSVSSTSPLLDYFYLQSKDFLPLLKNTPFSLSGRLGRFKLGFGEETWSDNPIEGILPSNSAGKIGATDEGLELAGKIKLDKIKIANYTLKPLGWVVSVSDGNSGVGSDRNSSRAFMGKLYYTPINPLYLSVSYYDSGKLGDQGAEMSIAGLVAPPGNKTTEWKRAFWEVDARYDIGKGKKPLEPIAYSDSKAILRLSYGQFGDDIEGTDNDAVKRNGQFGFVEGTYNITKRFYTAGRYSLVDLDGDQIAILNSIANTNRYQRYSLGLGYRWSENTILKLSYDWNREDGDQAVTEDKPNDLLSAIVASQF